MLVEDFVPTARQRLTTIEANASLVDAAKLLSNTHISLLVVCSPGGAMGGVVTKTDIIRQVAGSQENALGAPVSGIMTEDVVHCHPGVLLEDVWSNMKARGFVHIPVVDEEGRPLGVVNARDALQALLVEVKDEESLLRDYVMGIGYR
jgi:CBS domain-containing protein